MRCCAVFVREGEGVSRVRVGATVSLALILLVTALIVGTWARHRPPMDLGPAIVVTPAGLSSSTDPSPTPGSSFSMTTPTKRGTPPIGTVVEPVPRDFTPTTTQPVRTSSSPVPVAPPRPQPEKPIGAEPVSKPPVPLAGEEHDDDDDGVSSSDVEDDGVADDDDDRDDDVDDTDNDDVDDTDDDDDDD